MKRLLSIPVLVVLLNQGIAHGAEADTIPAILTLEQALSIADLSHPSVRSAEAALARSRASIDRLEGETALRANLVGDLRTVDKISVPGHDFEDDSRVLLIVDKPLSRFGAISDQRGALSLGVEGRSAAVAERQSALRVSIITAFLEVIVADYAYLAIDEENTLGYLAFSDAQEAMERFGEAAEVDVRALEAVYLDAYARRAAIANERRASRFRLALALNRPDEIPDQLVEPDLSGYDRPLPEYGSLIEIALIQNRALVAARLALESARDSLALATRAERPTLGVRFQAADYAQTFSGSRDQFRGSLYLDVPLVNKARRGGDIAMRNAEVLELEASTGLLEHQLRAELLALVQQITYLDRERAAAEAALLAAELNLDKVRLEYEMELKARIGSANWEVAKALHRLTRAKYQQAIAWEEIDALTGREPVAFNVE